MTASYRPAALACSATCRVPAMLDRSPTTTALAAGRAARASSALAALRACSVTEWPSSVSSLAAISPRPSVEPVMSTCDIGFLLLIWRVPRASHVRPLPAQVLPGGVHQFEGVAGVVASELAVALALDDVAANDHRLNVGRTRSEDHDGDRVAEPVEVRGSHVDAACVLAAAAVVLIPQVPLGLLTTAVQALAGILVPSATVFLLLRCNDREVLGPLVNPRWLNVLASGVIGCLIGLSALLTVTTIVPRLPSVPAITGLAAATAVVVVCATLIAIRARPEPASAVADRRTWTMPSIESLRPPARSAWPTLGLVVLRVYLLAAVIVLAVRAIQIALSSG
jgi:hypothetical protein